MLLIGNGKLITQDPANPYYEQGAVLVDGSRIQAVGSYEELKSAHPEAEFIDAKGMVIMPGLINTHHHIYSAFARGLNIKGNSPKNFLEILEGTWWKIDRQLTLENVYYSALTTYMECIQQGVTTVFDHHASYGAVTGSLFEIARAAKELSIRTSLAYEISDRDGVQKTREALEETQDFLQFVNQNNHSMIQGMVGLHASFTLSPETLKLCRREEFIKAGFHVHVAEGEYDESHCRTTYGKSVVKRLEEEGILGQRCIAGHCIHISNEDMDTLQRTNTMVVHNPQSNMGNAVGSPDVITMLDKKILVGLGTDGYTSDMFESLKTAHILQKHRRGLPDRGFLEATQLLFDHNAKIATRHFGQEMGVLKRGASADVILVDYQPYTPMTKDNLAGHLMFGMSGRMTDTTMIHGKIVMRGRKLITIDEKTIKEESIKSAQGLWNRLG